MNIKCNNSTRVSDLPEVDSENEIEEDLVNKRDKNFVVDWESEEGDEFHDAMEEEVFLFNSLPIVFFTHVQLVEILGLLYPFKDFKLNLFNRICLLLIHFGWIGWPMVLVIARMQLFRASKFVHFVYAGYYILFTVILLHFVWISSGKKFKKMIAKIKYLTKNINSTVSPRSYVTQIVVGAMVAVVVMTAIAFVVFSSGTDLLFNNFCLWCELMIESKSDYLIDINGNKWKDVIEQGKVLEFSVGDGFILHRIVLAVIATAVETYGLVFYMLLQGIPIFALIMLKDLSRSFIAYLNKVKVLNWSTLEKLWYNYKILLNISKELTSCLDYLLFWMEVESLLLLCNFLADIFSPTGYIFSFGQTLLSLKACLTLYLSLASNTARNMLLEAIDKHQSGLGQSEEEKIISQRINNIRPRLRKSNVGISLKIFLE